MVQVRHIARLEYGSSLPAQDRLEGDVAVFGSNGPVGQHNLCNTGSPVVVVGRKGSHGKLQYSSDPVFAIDTTYFIDPTCTQAHIRWLYYALSTLELDKTAQDVGVPGLSREYAYSQRLPLPSDTKQRAIADYLDTETNRIDTLITKKRRLIDLLEERRLVLVTAAVSQSRDRGARDWRRLKYFCRGLPQYGLNVPSSDYVHTGTRFLRTSDINERGEVVNAQPVYLQDQIVGFEYRLIDGDLLLSRSGTLGRCLRYRSDLGSPRSPGISSDSAPVKRASQDFSSTALNHGSSSRRLKPKRSRLLSRISMRNATRILSCLGGLSTDNGPSPIA